MYCEIWLWVGRMRSTGGQARGTELALSTEAQRNAAGDLSALLLSSDAQKAGEVPIPGGSVTSIFVRPRHRRRLQLRQVQA